MAGSDAAKQSEVLEAAYQTELKCLTRGSVSSSGTWWRLTPLMVSARRWGGEIEEQANEVAGLNKKGLTWQINRLLTSPPDQTNPCPQCENGWVSP